MDSLEYKEKTLKALSPEWKKIQTSNKITKNQFEFDINKRKKLSGSYISN